jgi:hypothetical protein
MVRHFGLFLSLWHFLASSIANAQGTVLHATVADATTGMYILDAEVTVDPVGLKGITDYFGDARFPRLAKGRYTVRARQIGFKSLDTEVEVSGQDSLEITMLLTPLTYELAPVTVDATMPSPFLKDFDERRRQGKGQYITDSVLRAANGRTLGDVLASKLRGVIISRQLSSAFIPFSARGSNSVRDRCRIDVYWNGVRITRNTSPTVDIPMDFVGGVEFYNPGFTPVQYQDPGNDCGVLLLWPRP